MAEKPKFEVKGIVNSTPNNGRRDMNVITVAGELDGKDVVVHLDARRNFSGGDHFSLSGVVAGDKPYPYPHGSLISNYPTPDAIVSRLGKPDEYNPDLEIKGVIMLNDNTGDWVPNKDQINADKGELAKIERSVNAYIKERGIGKISGKYEAFHEPHDHEKYVDKVRISGLKEQKHQLDDTFNERIEQYDALVTKGIQDGSITVKVADVIIDDRPLAVYEPIAANEPGKQLVAKLNELQSSMLRDNELASKIEKELGEEPVSQDSMRATITHSAGNHYKQQLSEDGRKAFEAEAAQVLQDRQSSAVKDFVDSIPQSVKDLARQAIPGLAPSSGQAPQSGVSEAASRHGGM